jgi:hypothetical protein
MIKLKLKLYKDMKIMVIISIQTLFQRILSKTDREKKRLLSIREIP